MSDPIEISTDPEVMQAPVPAHEEFLVYFTERGWQFGATFCTYAEARQCTETDWADRRTAIVPVKLPALPGTGHCAKEQT